jgi:hypothetical protein
MVYMSTTPTTNDREALVAFVDALPAYVDVKVTYVRLRETFIHHLLTREFPRAGRRLTSLTSGFEVMGFGAYLNTLLEMTDDGKVEVSIDPIVVAA